MPINLPEVTVKKHSGPVSPQPTTSKQAAAQIEDCREDTSEVGSISFESHTCMGSPSSSSCASGASEDPNVTLDYTINDNGSCTCKLCGEVVPSRTHWYRHKYKVSFDLFILFSENSLPPCSTF